MTDSELTTAITNIADGTPNTAAEIRAILSELQNRSAKSKVIILKDVTNQYITDNFDGSGLGINLEAGYAMCNGNNGTRNWAERVPVAYGGTMLTMGASGGASTHTLLTTEMPSHAHTVPANNGVGGVGGADYPSGGGANVSTSSVGGGQPHNNMQPYIVTLAVMKI